MVAPQIGTLTWGVGRKRLQYGVYRRFPNYAGASNNYNNHFLYISALTFNKTGTYTKGEVIKYPGMSVLTSLMRYVEG
jgi:hypothetical protein